MQEEKGVAGFVAVVVGLVSLLAKAHPTWHLIAFLAQNIPDFQSVLTQLAAAAVVVAGATHPAAFIRRILERLGIGSGPAVVIPKELKP